MASSSRMPATRLFCPKCQTLPAMARSDDGREYLCQVCGSPVKVITNPAFDPKEAAKAQGRLDLGRAREELCDAAIIWDDRGRSTVGPEHARLVTAIWRYRAAKP